MAIPQKKDERFIRRFSDATNDPRFEPRSRPTLAYSSEAIAEQGVRKVRAEARTSNMPGSPSNKAFDSSRRDSATEFNAEYEKKGLQPSSIDDPKPEQKNNSGQILDRSIRKQQVDYKNTQDALALQPVPQKLKIKLKPIKNAVISRARITAVTGSIWSWAFPFWVLQLVLALFNILALALVGAIDALLSVTVADPKDGTVFRVAKTVIGGVVNAATAVTKFITGSIGVDLSVLDPGNIYVLTTILIFTFGMLTLLTIYFIYKINRFEPIFGRGAGLKIGILILCVFGYFVPILNLVPWFLAWTLVVWIYPK